MDYKELKSAYLRIKEGKGSKDDKKKLIYEFNHLGGMSTEWFYSNIMGTIEDPSKEEIDEFLKVIESIL